MPATPNIVSWLHVGDLHITGATAQNAADFQAVIDSANNHLAGRVDFAVLPGDNADQGTESQFRLVRQGIDALAMPVYILPGDHDFHARTLDAFHRVLGAEKLPLSARIGNTLCLFLDVVSGGSGGPDFRLGAEQTDWLTQQCEAAAHAGDTIALFMHTYPADLQQGAEALNALLARYRIACVDMGHTHYNELANDGRTIFMATRSTGQIEEGPAGFSVAALDGGVVSWRFQPLDAPWPLVLITSPADHRLITDPACPAHVVRGACRIAAKIWGGAPIAQASASIDGGAAIALTADPADASYWHATTSEDLADGLHRLTVSATACDGSHGSETIVFLSDQQGHYAEPPRHRDGSDRDSIGAWPEKHLLGTQLGPNRNGRTW